MQNELLSRGYGEKYEKEFVLNSFESLYLSYIKKLKVFRSKKNISFDELINIYKKNDDDIFTKFLIYRDMRNRGYIVKNGFGFGSDFLVYEKGKLWAKRCKVSNFCIWMKAHKKKLVTFKKILMKLPKWVKNQSLR